MKYLSLVIFVLLFWSCDIKQNKKIDGYTVMEIDGCEYYSIGRKLQKQNSLL